MDSSPYSSEMRVCQFYPTETNRFIFIAIEIIARMTAEAVALTTLQAKTSSGADKNQVQPRVFAKTGVKYPVQCCLKARTKEERIFCRSCLDKPFTAKPKAFALLARQYINDKCCKCVEYVKCLRAEI